MEDSQEKKLINEVTTTPYEKVFSILHRIKKLLVHLSNPNNLYQSYINDLDWVIKRMTSRSLYTFEINETEIMKKNAKLKDFIECISDYSSLERKTFDLVRKGFDFNILKSSRLKLKSFKANEFQIKQIQELKQVNKSFNFMSLRSLSQDVNEKMEKIDQVKNKENDDDDNGMIFCKKDLTNQSIRKMIPLTFDFDKILTIDFDIMEFKREIGQEHVLPTIGNHIFERFGFTQDNIINSKKLDAFLFALNKGYFSTTLYHNYLHGADVTQTISLYLKNTSIEDRIQTNVIDIIGLITACLGHDLGHPGFNNNFIINSMNDIAIVYNDISVLENFHTANLMRVARREECNIFETFTPIEYKAFRKRVIGCILATDMVNHPKVVGVIRSKLSQLTPEIIQENQSLVQAQSTTVFGDQQEYLDFLIHLADLAHNTKRFEISKQWVDLLNLEFWNQGDKEKEMGMPISYLCDRKTADTPKSQVGFINAFIIPSFKVLVTLCPSLDIFLTNAKINLKRWEILQEENERKMESMAIRRCVTHSKENVDSDESLQIKIESQENKDCKKTINHV